MRYSSRPTGAALHELLIVLVFAGIALPVLLIALNRARESHRKRIDSIQVSGFQRGLTRWARDNAGSFPLPSVVDDDDTTVAVKGTGKDTTANIVSLLIYTGELAPEIVVSPSEPNTSHIAADNDYMWEDPALAVNPEEALWDPAFAADFSGASVGNVSYAHVLPGGGRGGLWRDTAVTTEPVLGNRGPAIGSITREVTGMLKPTYASTSSNTFRFHGHRNSWQGHIAYNDGHVNFEIRTDPEGVVFSDAAGKKWSDCLFFDEPDDASGTNAWMSIWTTAGDAKGDFTPIWD